MKRVVNYTINYEMAMNVKKILGKLFVFSLAIFSSCSNPEYVEVEVDPNIISPSPVGDIVGKVVVGYQGWFGAVGDGSPFNSWRHWAGSGVPAPNNQTFELYPDVREYPNSYQTGYANLGSGDPAKLFSSWDDQTVNLHFKWMKQYGIHTAALQRFGNHMAADPRDRNFKDGIAQKVRASAEANQVKFFIWYDISGWTNFQSEIKADWLNKMKANINSTMYAKQNDRPVVCLWGMGVSNRPGDGTSYLDVIKWFQDQGCYVIVGTARNWRSQADFIEAFKAADMISPWSVGTFADLAGADKYKDEVMKDDLSFLTDNKQDYLPVVFPGFSWSNWKPGTVRNEIPRLHGDFMWRQFKNIVNLGIQNSYVAMFDEYDEATAIAKAAENSSQVPTNQYFLTLDADSVKVSSDFYLRLTNDAGKLLKRQLPVTDLHPTAHN